MIKTTKEFKQLFLKKEPKEMSDFLHKDPHSLSVCIEDGKFKHLNISDGNIGHSYYARDIKAIEELISCLELAKTFLEKEAVTENCS